jgi:excisionase family DNA binding protein
MAEKIEVMAFSVGGMSTRYGIGQSTIRRAIRNGEIPISRVHRRIVIRLQDAEKWVGAPQRRKGARKA